MIFFTIESLQGNGFATLFLSTSSSGTAGTLVTVGTDAPDIEIADRLSLRQVIASLEAEDRKLIYLRYFQNKTQMETAKQLGMSQVQVSRREKKLLTLMREQLK